MVKQISITRFSNSKLKVGLLGGSFNPAHAGHLCISQSILKTLKLDYIWWLVSPRNPLKAASMVDSHYFRYHSALKIAQYPYIIVTDIEKNINSNYTIDVINRLKTKFPRIDFVWLMGADNLQQFDKWHKWKTIFAKIPIIVYDRDPHTYSSMRGKASISYKQDRANSNKVRELSKRKAPAWGFLRLRKHPLSSTILRKKDKEQII